MTEREQVPEPGIEPDTNEGQDTDAPEDGGGDSDSTVLLDELEQVRVAASDRGRRERQGEARDHERGGSA